MRITILGAGPAGLYCALLLKKADPRADVRVIERNPAGATYGWGVVFSDRTLASFREADYPSYKTLEDSFVIWDAIDVHYRDTVIRCGGHVIAGVARRRLLGILQDRCAELGVELRFESDITDLAQLGDYDLLIAADGANSRVRRTHESAFRPTVEMGRAKYVWFGTDLLLDSFAFFFRESAHGLFQVHAYPFSGDQGTFIVECSEETWRRAGLDRASEAESIAFCEQLFAPDLHGARLLSNRSLWVGFPTLRTARWSHQHMVLLGDAAHTAHFSIGSGTKLAMEDAIALANALVQHGGDVGRALSQYELERKPIVETLQAAAQESRAYFETLARYLDLDPVPFAFQLLTRSGRVTYDDLRLRDPRFGALVDLWFDMDAGMRKSAAEHGPTPTETSVTELMAEMIETEGPSNAVASPPAFAPLPLTSITLRNRVALLPQRFGGHDGAPGEPGTWGLWDSNAGLYVTEPLAVSAEARIYPDSLGLYTPEQEAVWTQHLKKYYHRRSPAMVGVVLNHAGRRGSTRRAWPGEMPDRPLRDGNWSLIAPSAQPYTAASQTPRATDRSDMERVRDQFVRSAWRAYRADFDLLLLHMAHGYLLASFLSPLANQRADEYGGALESRMRFPLEVLDAVRAVWPKRKPLGVILNADDCAPGGLTIEEAVIIARALNERGCDLIQPLAGQTVPDAAPVYRRGFLTRYSERIRHEAGVPTLVGGYLTTMDEVNTILAAGRADLCILEPSPLSAIAHTCDGRLQGISGEGN